VAVIAATRDGRGHWLVTENDQLREFGDASVTPTQPCVGPWLALRPPLAWLPVAHIRRSGPSLRDAMGHGGAPGKPGPFAEIVGTVWSQNLLASQLLGTRLQLRVSADVGETTEP
jgi:hypothetical protein